MQNLIKEFLKVTESAAIASSEWKGKGDKIKADLAAVKAMREEFNSVNFSGVVVIGEGEKDEAPMLYIGEKVGNGNGPKMDIAVDPLECTSNLASGKPNSISVLAAGSKGSLFGTNEFYMDQLVVGPKAKDAVDITKSIKENIENVAKALGKDVKDVTIAVLKRDRHKELIKQIEDAGANIKLIEHGTISFGIATALPDSGIDIMAGIAGAPEGVITAVAVKCLGGNMQGKIGDKIYGINSLVKDDNPVFIATGISTGFFLKGVEKTGDNMITHSLIITKQRTEYIDTIQGVD